MRTSLLPPIRWIRPCLYNNVESAQAVRENVKEALTAILSEIASRTRSFLNSNYLEDIWYDIITKRSSIALNEILTRWAEKDNHPKILIIDE